jgi:hypothetical protein
MDAGVVCAAKAGDGLAVGVAVGGGLGETCGVGVGVGVRHIHQKPGGHAALAKAGHAASARKRPTHRSLLIKNAYGV